MIGKLFGIGAAAHQIGSTVGGVAEVFVGNRAERDLADHERFQGSLAQFGKEFGQTSAGGFDRFVNGLNRLPRPAMAIGTLCLFVYAMAEPEGFAVRMQGLAFVPEPLWWLLGAIVSFYFGARELHHYRGRAGTAPKAMPPLPAPADLVSATPRPTDGTQTSIAPIEPVLALERDAGIAASQDLQLAAPVASRPIRVDDPTYNAAFEEWRASRT